MAKANVASGGGGTKMVFPSISDSQKYSRINAGQVPNNPELSLFTIFARQIVASNLPLPPVQSCSFYDHCTATMAFSARFEHFRGKPIEVPVLEQFTHQAEYSKSSPIKPNQA